jgi:hypothetical protein
MQTPFTAGAFQPEAALAGAAASFFELLKSFGAQAAGAPAPDWAGLRGALAGQFEQWLRASPAAGPAFAAAAGFAPGTGFPPAWGPLAGAVPLGAAAAPAGEGPNAWELLVRLAQLQAQLAAHWSEIANSAAHRFVARAGAPAARPLSSDDALKLYELWVQCAEEAYGATVRTEAFCRLQADLANTGAALLLAQRRYADALARAWGLPTREEADALQRQIRELRARLDEQARAAPSRTRAQAAAARPRARPAPGERSRRKPSRRGRRPRA